MATEPNGQQEMARERKPKPLIKLAWETVISDRIYFIETQNNKI
jgi:hypothetical protein